jgi:threonine aldolase
MASGVRSSDERERRAAWARCERVVGTFSPAERDPRSTLRTLAGRAPAIEDEDRYGEGALAELEARVAGLLGKEAAVWMPSGTMAQQIALRIHCDRRGTRRIAFHPQCHLDVHEERGYAHLHGLVADLIGPRERLPTADDLDAIREPVGAVLLELPARELGGQLPPWDELIAFCAKAGERDVALHMDGARLWQCAPFYGRDLDAIAGLFDTVYVSFYKDLGAPAGAMLAGTAAVIDEARVWRIRHGGRLFTAYPFLIAAERGLDEVLPRMPEFVAHAKELAAALADVDGIDVLPDPPHTAMFHLFVRRELDPLNEAALDIAERTRTFIGRFAPTEVPGMQTAELTVGVASLDVPVAGARELYRELMSASA